MRLLSVIVPLVSLSLFPALALAQAFVRGDGDATRCTLEPEGDGALQRCASGASPERTSRLTCTTLVVGDVDPEPGLESVVTCVAPADDESTPPESVVALRTARRFAYARRLSGFAGASADVLRLRFTGEPQRDVLLHVGDEDSVRLFVLGYRLGIVEELLVVTEAWGMAAPDTAVTVRYEPGSPAFVETVETTPGARPVRRRYRWRRGDPSFGQISGPR